MQNQPWLWQCNEHNKKTIKKTTNCSYYWLDLKLYVTDWLSAWLIGLTHWLTHSLIDWLTEWSVDQSISLLIDQPINWLTYWFHNALNILQFYQHYKYFYHINLNGSLTMFDLCLHQQANLQVKNISGIEF